MQIIQNKNLVYFCVIIMLLISFYFGFNKNDCNLQSLGTYEINADLILFKKILIQNIGFYFLILFGSLFYNISNFFLILYNGAMWGISAKNLSCTLGDFNSTLLVLPHILIEVLWIVMSVQLSLQLSKYFFELLNESISPTKFMIGIKSLRKQFILILIFTIAGAIVEVYLSPLTYNIFKI